MKNVLVTWDIDGTLITGTDAAVEIHQNAFKQACEEIFSQPCDVPDKFLGVSLNGFMDQKILKMMYEKLGSPPTEELMNRGIHRMEEIFLEQCSVVPQIASGVSEMLATLSAMPNVTIGVASGNWPRIAWRKLELAHLEEYFRKDGIAKLGFFDDRRFALEEARKEAEAKKGAKMDICIHIGDTVGDVNAAISAGFIAIAVRTGRTAHEYPQPSYVFDTVEAGREQILNIINQ
ncbi:haloacid dehalogenase-like hydrolase family protein [Tritrichomonas foetus]|uniref:Haloacid dehalogenase-like hydrolase family protein n=1 Tax=Tritrichomonas foetus TaxID=1144522 RepID=A0A1J4J407_9EUKA|nr:haloacid dehalogenase-like hydrolase family protein [Tritrichomonas foetus]|eukprot:OHS94098.1 haloacid dehalogenase-like hydrolase family protein [Tritrichomonas foetus]